MTQLPKWTPFVVGKLPDVTDDLVKATAEGFRISEEEARAALVWNMQCDVWVNSRYQVNVRRTPAVSDLSEGEIVHLSIKRLDKQPPGPERWRDFQRIKNELVGPEYEAIEIYPAESRLVDTANQYHLWAVKVPGFRFPFGFQTDGAAYTLTESRGGAEQRPFEED